MYNNIERDIIKEYRNELKKFLKLCKEYEFVLKQHVLKTRFNEISWLNFKPIFKRMLRLMLNHSSSFKSFEYQLQHRTKAINNYIKWYNNDIYKLVEQYQ